MSEYFLHNKLLFMNAQKAETLVQWYLRFNGYFTVENFIVHAGDDSARISRQVVGNHTETDVLGIRHKHTREVSGSLYVANDFLLQIENAPDVDFVIAEVKTGNQDKPNKIWSEGNVSVIAYIIRFAGFVEKEEEINELSKLVAQNGEYTHSSNKYSIRLLIFSESDLNKNWRHLKNIKLVDVVEFLVRVRGESWINAGLGVASVHYQWDPLINSIFEVANNFNLSLDERRKEIFSLLT